MLVADALRSLGGCARAKQLRALTSRGAIKAAVGDGTVTKTGRVYALVPSTRGPRLASELCGIRSHRSAAEHWELALPPGDSRVDVTVPSNARRTQVPDDAHLHYRDHQPDEADRGVTTPLRTVLDCLRDEPLRTALSVGDSALRRQLVTWEELSEAVALLRGPRSRLARERLAMLDARAENAFESSCRAILLEAGIIGFEPQVKIRHRRRFVGRVDLAHAVLRIVIECEGFATHGGREAFVRDLVRHTELAAAGWRSLRVTWELVMFRPEWVLECVQDVIADVERSRRTGGRARKTVQRARKPGLAA